MATKSCELDSMPTLLLKKACPALLRTLTDMVNKSLETGTFPEDFKNARIRPLLKKPSLDPDVMSNYRPVSNIPFLAQVIEKVVSARLTKYLSSGNLLDPMQSAYRQYHSTETALSKLHDDVTRAMDHGKGVFIVALDLSAAFDTIDHAILLRRLESDFGIGGLALKWLASYMTGRFQEVTVKGHVSRKVPLHFGVPQGSVLGPQLFSLYTTPIGHIIRKHLLPNILFADDNNLYIVFDPTNPTEVAHVIQKLTGH